MTKPNVTILTGVALLLTGYFCQAATINAPTGSFIDVSNTVAQASPGDTVVMPPGTNVWPQTLWLPAGISLLGSGTHASGTNTTIICGLDSGGVGNICAIACDQLSGVNITRLSGFILQGTNVVNAQDTGCIWMNPTYTGAGVAGQAVPWRIDHVVFNGLPMNNIKVGNVHSGLIDHCVFNISQYFPGQIIRLTESDSDVTGSYSYSVPYVYGGTNALYIEHCFFTNSAGYLCGLCDADGGGSLVLRYNMIYNCQYNNHGTEGTSVRAQRSYEIYDNIWVANDPSCVWSPAMLIRGGTGVIYSNTVIGWKYVESTFVKRVMQWCTTVEGADGLSRFDSNDPTIYLQGVWNAPAASATNNYTWLTSDITFTNITPWTPNQWVGYTVINMNAPYFFTNDNLSPVYWFGTIVANTTNTLSVVNPKNSYADQGPQIPNLTFQPGDVYQFRRVIHTLDQIGLGSGDYLTGSSSGWTLSDGTAADGAIPPLANEVSEPLYWWSNTLNSASSGLSGQLVNFDNCGFAIIQQNRDYFNDTPKPGYVPLGSHPLTGETNTAGATNTFAASNVVLTATNPVSLAVQTVTNGLVAWYPLAGDANDYSGNGNNGTLVSSPGFATGPNGSTNAALALNGSGQCVTIPSAPTIILTSNLTVTAWVYLNVSGGRNELVTKGVSGNSDGLPAPFELYQGNDLNPGSIGLAVGNDVGSYDKIVSGNLLTNTWCFVTATLAGNVASLYTNGVLSASGTVSATLVDGGGNLMIGNNNQNWYPMNGDIAQVRLFNRALSPAEIAGLYSSDLASLASTNAVNPPTNPAPPPPPPLSPPSNLIVFPH